MVSQASKDKQARQRSADAQASASVAKTVSDSKQSIGDNRGYAISLLWHETQTQYSCFDFGAIHVTNFNVCLLHSWQ